jgi:2-keto-4-pentenoate hydratase/2-oxohepta-3-ene-1,7-dioic acid hydratase in catechol pathway
MISKYFRFSPDNGATTRFALLEGETLRSFTAAPWDSGKPTDDRFPFNQVQILAPVTPSKIVCVGRNYAEHAAELGNEVPKEPLLFLKPPSAIVGTGQAIRIPELSQQVEHEGEIGVVIGKQAKDIRDDVDPMDFVFGFTSVNDVTARDIQRRDIQFTRGKSFDTFCPVGPGVVAGLAAHGLDVRTTVNGVTRQAGNTNQMVFPIPFLVRYISRMMTLEPGDLIATGTPSGVGRIEKGDIVEVQISNFEPLRNPVE